MRRRKGLKNSNNLSNFQGLCPPPHRFRPAGKVAEAEFCLPPSFVRTWRPKNKKQTARERGLAYERKAHKYIEREFPDTCIIGPWIKFKNLGQETFSYCQPDALVLDLRNNSITVIEIKLKHTSDAWWQVRRLYTPVVQHIFGPSWNYIAIEMAKWFDPHTKFPERFEFIDALQSFPISNKNQFHLHIWNGRLTE